MTSSKFCMFKDLEELQVTGCQTDVCLVGAGGEKTFIHRASPCLAWAGPWGRWRQSCGDYSRCLSFGIRAKLIVCYWRKVTFCACFIKYPTLLAQHMWSCLQLSKSVAAIQFVTVLDLPTHWNSDITLSKFGTLKTLIYLNLSLNMP